MTQDFFHHVLNGYTPNPAHKQQLGETAQAAKERIRDMLRDELNAYLNIG